jgi:Zinc carboxypeptidase.
MSVKFFLKKSVSLCLLGLIFSLAVFAQAKIPAPADVLGFTPGDDRKLASWNQVLEYFRKLEESSLRVRFEEIGKSTMGKPFVYATISAPENLKELEKYKQINQKLADPRLIKSNDKLAQELIKQGKTIVLVTCGIHSTEVGSTLSSMLIAHRLASSDEPEILKILENTIVLLVPSLNPDGVDIVKDWYDKTLGTPFEGTSPPELYHKYLGHDNNRDWYIFSQVETQLTVDKIHNVWHPQIVHDIHQQGAFGARLFLPPYMQPVEPNVPKEIIEGYTELGLFMANDLRAKGFQGITTNSTYDAWTPARAYSHYHGGVRILSETASARLATPINVKSDDLRGDLGYDAKKESENFSPVWQGGEWRLRDITNYMTSAAFSLLKHAADNRERWLSRFYAIGKEAVRPRTKKGELYGFRVKISENFSILEGILQRAGVQYGFPKGEGKTTVKKTSYSASKAVYPAKSIIIPMEQPYGAFAKAILEKQVYPNLKDEKGEPISPYDVTAHTLSLLMNIEAEEIRTPFKPNWIKNAKVEYLASDCHLGVNNKIGIYKSHIPSMDEGWTRWVFENAPCMEYENITNEEIRAGNFNQKKPPFDELSEKLRTEKGLDPKYRTIVFPDQSPNQILNGYAKGSMPDELTGGLGKEGVKNLRDFVEQGGTLVFLNRSARFAIREFGLPVRDVTEGLPRKDFYIPGSILRTEINTNHKIAAGMPARSIAWFEHSPVFEITMSDDTNVEIIAGYPKDANEILLSGWALGTERLAGKAALVSINIGRGKIILFGFRPQYRGQSLATLPLLFNAIAD